jgi:PAS domain S-box-containing protein
MPHGGPEQCGKGRTSKVKQPIGDFQSLHALAFDLAVVGMALAAPDSTLLQANASFCDLLGYTREELLALPAGAIVHPDDRQDEAARHARVLAGVGTSERALVSLLHRNGEAVRVEATRSLVPQERGRPARLLLQVRETGAAHAAQSALREAQARLESASQRVREQAQLLEHSREAIVVHDLDHTIRHWNAGAQSVFGFRAEEAIGQTFATLMGPAAALPVAAFRQLLDHGEWMGQVECADSQGHILVVERHCMLLRDARGQAASVLAIHTDITERRRAEKEIVLLNNLLEQRIRKRTAELEESNEDLRDFAYSLAHDLRAPLASIDGFSAQLEVRLAPVLDRDTRHYLTRVRAGVKLMSDLTDALLALADLSNTPLLHQGVDMSAVARAIAERLREQDPDRHSEFVIEETPPAQGDVRLLANMMENLLGNAWKFTSKMERAQIVFGGQAWPNGSYLYHVKDNGAGFDPAYAYKLFGPFQRLHTADEFEGTGIGLAMVRKIVSRHGGRVWAESMPGEGASFYFSLNESGGSPAARGNTAPSPLS